MTTLTIRNARQDEAALLTDIAKRSKAYWGYDEKFMAKCQEELTVKSKNIGKDDSAHVVAEKENKVIGFYALQNIDGKEFELGALYVAAEHIKTGVGYELMAHAKNRAAALGGRTIIIQSDPNAIGFYTASGAIHVGTRKSLRTDRDLPLLRITLITPSSALLLIDVQKGFDSPCWGKRNNLSAEDNIAKLLSIWRKRGYPIIHIQHCSTNPDSPLASEQSGNEFKKEAQPLADEKQFPKTVNSAFIGTALEDHLQKNNIFSLVIVGLTTDHCVSTTTRMAANLGFNVILVSDATATFERMGHDGNEYSADEIHKTGLASLNGEFCVIRSTDEVLNDFKKAC